MNRKIVYDSMFWYLTLFLSFAVVFYNFIETITGFKYIDELLYAFLLALFVVNGRLYRDVLVFLAILAGYALYSYLIRSNTPSAILMDCLIQSKPFMAFFICYHLAPVFAASRKVVWRRLCLLLYLFLVAVGLLALASGHIGRFMGEYYGDTGNGFSSSVIIVSLVYYLLSAHRKKDKFTFICMLLLAIIAGKSRFYGFLAFSGILFVLGKNIRLKVSLKNVILTVMAAGAVVAVSWTKIEAYFMPESNEESARLALYQTAWKIMGDYVPFGTGLASFGTQASREYYADTYDDYQISTVWGLSRQHDSFITDAYFPSLAQFGVAGFVLAVYFLILILKRYRRRLPATGSVNRVYTEILILILVYLFVESVASAILSSSRGMFLMSLIGILAARNAFLFRLLEPDFSNHPVYESKTVFTN